MVKQQTSGPDFRVGQRNSSMKWYQWVLLFFVVQGALLAIGTEAAMGWFQFLWLVPLGVVFADLVKGYGRGGA